MKFLGVFLISSLLYAVNAKGVPSVRLTRKSIVDVGGHVEFVCSVWNVQVSTVLWRKDDGVILASGRHVIMPDPRFSVRSNGSNFTFGITDIREADAGDYHCQFAIDPRTNVTATVPLHVRKQPVIADNSTLRLSLKENDEGQLECYAEGFPIPTITWQREHNARLPNGEHTHRGNVLHIPAARREYSGLYYCIAANGVGRDAIRAINVNILFAPIVVVPRPRVGQALGYDADLACRVESFPRSYVNWHNKNGEELFTNANYTQSLFDTSEGYMEAIIRIKAIKKSQYGQYTCTVHNKFGREVKQIELFETDTPICPPACDSTGTNGIGAASNVTQHEIRSSVVQNITDST